MAHELEIVDGKASFFSVLQTAWHRLGAVLPKAPDTVTEALELMRANFEVGVVELSYTVNLPNGDSYQQPSRLASSIVRLDNMRELGTASPKFPVMQDEDAYRVLNPLISEGLATIETGGVLRNGSDTFMLVKWNLERFPELVQKTFGKELLPFALVSNSHSGKRGIVKLDTAVRAVCANTLNMAMRAASSRIVTKHSQIAPLRHAEGAQKLWGNLIEKYTAVSAEYEALKLLIIDEQTFKRTVLDVIAALPQDSATFDPKGKYSRVVVERAENKRAELTRLWRDGAGHTGNGSAWEAYNGAVEALDHGPLFFSGRSPDARAVALLDGPLAAAKGAVYGGLLELTA